MMGSVQLYLLCLKLCDNDDYWENRDFVLTSWSRIHDNWPIRIKVGMHVELLNIIKISIVCSTAGFNKALSVGTGASNSQPVFHMQSAKALFVVLDTLSEFLQI